jgi:dihydrofolate synthase/folylpolyglutamate synthase
LQTKQQVLDDLYSLQRFGIKPGLERTYNILSDFGDPQDKFQSIHIAGTNGKGFTCSAMASILMESGFKVGLYTSPHLREFNERIIINGDMISDDDIIALAEKLMQYSEKINATFFEITTAMAFIYFAEKNVDIAVVETGMGGRFDSTNVLKPLVSVITDIGMEHQEYLGDTLQKIAFEKAGIIKEETPLVVSRKQTDVMHVFIDKADQMASSMHYAEDIADITVLSYNPDFTLNINLSFDNIKIENLKLPAAGIHQIRNLQLSLSALQLTREKFDFNQEQIIKGLEKIRENAFYHCRLELVRKSPMVLLDSAHNPQAIEALTNTLDNHGHSDTKWNILYAAMSDKDVKSILHFLKPYCKALYITEPRTDRSMPTEKIVEIAKELSFSRIIQNKNSKEAYSELIKQRNPILVCGSFFLVGEIF